LSVAGLLCLRPAASIKLWVEQTGPYSLDNSTTGPVLEGSTVTINCRVTGHHPLDVVRLVRQVDDVDYELTTNELLKKSFADTGRYRIIEYDAVGLQRFVKLQITRKTTRAVVYNTAN